MSEAFVHLRVHSEYSLVDSTVRLKPLLAAARAQDMPALAVTDEGNLFALVKFYKAALAAGIKPIVGADVRVVTAQGLQRMTLLCQHRDGYRNLSRLLTRSHLEGRHDGKARLQADWVVDHAEGLIALLPTREMALGEALRVADGAAASTLVEPWQAVFGDRLYLEISRTGQADDETIVAGAVELAMARGLPLVATNDVRFLTQEEFQAHEVRVCIHESVRLDDEHRPRIYTDQQYLKSAAAMRELFADLPSALDNTVEIARRCNLTLELGHNVLPDFPVPEGHDAASYLEQVSREGLERRLAGGELHATREEYEQRLQREIGVINQMGFPGYFLIVADFIRWSRENDVPVGPGRGSGAGSLVAWVLEITDLDPLQFDLLFERFLNPERVSMPDFDVDFCIDGRDRVIDYVAQQYGRDHVSQIITYGSMAAKAVVRDVGRVLGHGYGYVDSIAKLIPPTLGITLSEALKESPELAQRYRAEEEVTELIDTALKLEGLSRNAGKHAGGVVIAPQPLTEYTPLYVDPDGHPVTQFDKNDVEEVGLVKFDFLGLKTLTVVSNAAKLVNRARAAKGEPPIDERALPLDDESVFQLLQSGKVTACFQIESAGMRRLVRDLKPDRFEDIVALLALFRPGPLQTGMVDDFVKRKLGEQAIVYPHPSLEPILEPTYGVILYQEQVMQIAQVLSGYTLGGADLLRRAMGKKKPEEMAKQRSIFIEGAENNGVDGKLAGEIFDLVEKFAGYGFNKSHSAAYAYVAYQTAWLKAHYPAHFMCATLSADLDNTDKLVPLIEDCRALGLDVRPPSVNESEYAFTVEQGRAIRYGLGALKGVGRGPVEAILEERSANGAFKDLFDFCARVDVKRLNRRVLEALIKAGGMDGFGSDRAVLLAALPAALGAAEQRASAAEAGQHDMFGHVESADDAAALDLPDVPPWRAEDILRAEKESMGLYFSVHPMDVHRDELEQFAVNTIAGMIANGVPEGGGPRGGRNRGREVVAVGVLWSVRILNDQRAFLTLDDGTGRLSCVLYDEQIEQYRHLLHKERPLVIYGRLSYDSYEDGYRIAPIDMFDLDEARKRFADCLLLALPDRFTPAELSQPLKAHHRPNGVPVHIRVRHSGLQGDIELGANWRVDPSEALLQDLSRRFGRNAVRLRYQRPDYNAAMRDSE